MKNLINGDFRVLLKNYKKNIKNISHSFEKSTVLSKKKLITAKFF